MNLMQDEITWAANIIRKGGIVIFPTDTAFGIGCRIDDKKAIQRLFTMRKRPETQATPVLIDSLKMAQEYLLPIPDDVKKELIDKYWPGALTIILQCKIDKVPLLVRGGTNTLGVRMPDHLVTKELIKKVGVPILGPSANFHGQKTPYEFSDLDERLMKVADYVIHGDCTIKKASTVIDASQKLWKVLREGAIRI